MRSSTSTSAGSTRRSNLRDGVLTRLTRDDSLVQRLVDSGAVTAAEARTHPQRSLVLDALDGHPERRPPPVTAVAARAGDRLLLCSDGRRTPPRTGRYGAAAP